MAQLMLGQSVAGKFRFWFPMDFGSDPALKPLIGFFGQVS